MVPFKRGFAGVSHFSPSYRAILAMLKQPHDQSLSIHDYRGYDFEISSDKTELTIHNVSSAIVPLINEEWDRLGYHAPLTLLVEPTGRCNACCDELHGVYEVDCYGNIPGLDELASSRGYEFSIHPQGTKFECHMEDAYPEDDPGCGIVYISYTEVPHAS